jgi:hypothetical protein
MPDRTGSGRCSVRSFSACFEADDNGGRLVGLPPSTCCALVLRGAFPILRALILMYGLGLGPQPCVSPRHSLASWSVLTQGSMSRLSEGRLYSERADAITGSRSRWNAGPLCNLHA